MYPHAESIVTRLHPKKRCEWICEENTVLKESYGARSGIYFLTLNMERPSTPSSDTTVRSPSSATTNS